MNYVNLIRDTLAPLNIPIKERVYTGTAPAYVVFSCYFIGDDEFADNDSVDARYCFMINIFRKIGSEAESIDSLRDKAMNLLKSAEFGEISASDKSDLETDASRWLIDCSFNLNEENKE